MRVVRRIETKGYRLARLELRSATPELLAEHYAEHVGKPFYQPLVDFMLSGPVVAMVVEGERVIEGFRSLAGATDPTVAAPGTIRGRPRARLGREGAAEHRPRLPTRPSLRRARSHCGSPNRSTTATTPPGPATTAGSMRWKASWART